MNFMLIAGIHYLQVQELTGKKYYEYKMLDSVIKKAL